MSSGRSSKMSVLLGGKQSSAGVTPQGGSEARAAGPRSPGSPEEVTFKREKIKATALDSKGRVIATLPFNGELPEGEALLEYKKVLHSAQERASKVDREAIPLEFREKVKRYMKTLQEPFDQ